MRYDHLQLFVGPWLIGRHSTAFHRFHRFCTFCNFQRFHWETTKWKFRRKSFDFSRQIVASRTFRISTHFIENSLQNHLLPKRVTFPSNSLRTYWKITNFQSILRFKRFVLKNQFSGVKYEEHCNGMIALYSTWWLHQIHSILHWNELLLIIQSDRRIVDWSITASNDAIGVDNERHAIFSEWFCEICFIARSNFSALRLPIGSGARCWSFCNKGTCPCIPCCSSWCRRSMRECDCRKAVHTVFMYIL